MEMRNYAFAKAYLKQKSYPIPVICIGNLNTGGTGKTPMTEYVVNVLKQDKKISVLSRGYGRKTKGFYEVTETSSPTEVGDEPLQIYLKNKKDIRSFVSEKRVDGIDQILEMYPDTELIVLDDAYQHRYVKPSFTILLTSYGDLYCDDYVLPAGNLREFRKGASRADVVVVTKCSKNLSQNEQREIENRMRLNKNQKLFFSHIAYADANNDKESIPVSDLSDIEVDVVTGIANPTPFLEYISSQGLSYTHHRYSDHHNFTAQELQNIATHACVLTTEKDYVRIQAYDKSNIYQVPIQAVIDKNEVFDTLLIEAGGN